jgi:hypothetical protein
MTKGIIKKLIKFIKIKVLTKELEFRALKTHKNMKTTKNSAPGATPYVYNERNMIFIS